MTGDALRARCVLLLDEITGAEHPDDAVDAMVAVFTEVQAAGLTADDRRSLAAIYGYELGVEEGALEVANIRRLLDRHGVAEADRLGVRRSTIAMVEELILTRGAHPG